MKKNILIFGTAIVALCLMAFGYISLNNEAAVQLEPNTKSDIADNTKAKEKIEKRTFSDFIYGIGPRFSPIKKEELNKVKSVTDFLDIEKLQRIESLNSASVIIIKGDKESDISETGTGDLLTQAQIELLQSSEFSTNFKIRAEYTQKNKNTGQIEDSYSTPHYTIVPDKQAEYAYGNKALIEYLKENIKDYTVDVDPEKLQPAKLYFTVTKTGAIKNVNLDRTSNFPEIDKKMMELISNLEGIWNPAENSKGEKMDQELVVSFGLMGC